MILLEFQKRFGKDLWAHAMVVVNRWDFYGDKSRTRFAAQFREVLQGPIESGLPGQPSNTHFGLGLTEEECNKMLPFAFLNVQRRQTEVKAMEIELGKMKAKLKELEPWHVRVKAQSEPLNDLIDAVRKSNDSATLKHVFDSAKSTVDKPTDLTEEKLSAVEEEILRREDLEAAEESLTKAVEAFNSFKEEGTSKHAETVCPKVGHGHAEVAKWHDKPPCLIFEAFVGHAESCLRRKEKIVPRPAHRVAAEGEPAA